VLALSIVLPNPFGGGISGILYHKQTRCGRKIEGYGVAFRKNANLPLGLTYEDLPPWMRRTRREVDWALLVIMVVALVAVWPLLMRPGLPNTPGMRVQVSRAVEMSESIQAGILYPRWAADFNFGYGSPLWNYLAPLPHYLTGLYRVLIQVSPQNSVKAVLAFSLVAGTLALFCFVRRRWGTYAGLIAAAVYLYSPQMLWVKPFVAGDMPVLLAVSCFLTCLWSFDRLLAHERGWDVITASLMLAGLWLSHTPLNLVLVGILIGWLCWRMQLEDWTLFQLIRVVLVVAGGTAISAFYWLPALLERPAVYWQAAADLSTVAWHQLEPGDLLGLPALIDRSQINPPPEVALGVPVWGLALLALVTVWVWTWQQTPPDRRPVSRGEALQARFVRFVRMLPASHHEALYFALVGATLFVLVTPLAAVLWQAFPAWPPLYPPDLLPLIVLCWAIVAGLLGHLPDKLHRPAWGGAMILAILAVILLGALPLLAAVSPWPEGASSDVLAVLRDETRGYAVASQLEGWLLPVDVLTLPQPTPTLIASYEDRAVDKVARDRLPPAVHVDIVSHSPQLERLVVTTSGPIDLTLLTFNFPGWTSRVNGRVVSPKSEPVTGLLTLPVPEGYHEIEVHFGTTVPRSIGWAISTLAGVIVVTAGVRYESMLSRRQALESREKSLALVPQAPVSVLLVGLLLFAAGGAASRAAPARFTRRSPPGIVLSAQHQFPRTLQGVIDLLAYDIEPQTRLHPGDELTVTLYWRAVRPDLLDYQSELAITAVNYGAQVIAKAQHRHPGQIPVSQWPQWPLLENYVRDTYYLRVDPNALAGEYNIVIQLGRCGQFSLSACDTITPLFVYDGRGSRLGQEIVLPVRITVAPVSN
jgi:hypothetical protein